MRALDVLAFCTTALRRQRFRTLMLFVAIGIDMGLTAMIPAHIAFCIPFAYLPIKARLQGMNPSLEEAAQDLYANRFVTFRRVTLPLLWPGIMAGFTLAFVTSLDDFLTSFFLSGPGSTIATLSWPMT